MQHSIHEFELVEEEQSIKDVALSLLIPDNATEEELSTAIKRSDMFSIAYDLSQKPADPGVILNISEVSRKLYDDVLALKNIKCEAKDYTPYSFEDITYEVAATDTPYTEAEKQLYAQSARFNVRVDSDRITEDMHITRDCFIEKDKVRPSTFIKALGPMIVDDRYIDDGEIPPSSSGVMMTNDTWKSVIERHTDTIPIDDQGSILQKKIVPFLPENVPTLLDIAKERKDATSIQTLHNVANSVYGLVPRRMTIDEIESLNMLLEKTVDTEITDAPSTDLDIYTDVVFNDTKWLKTVVDEPMSDVTDTKAVLEQRIKTNTIALDAINEKRPNADVTCDLKPLNGDAKLSLDKIVLQQRTVNNDSNEQSCVQGYLCLSDVVASSAAQYSHIRTVETSSTCMTLAAKKMIMEDIELANSVYKTASAPTDISKSVEHWMNIALPKSTLVFAEATELPQEQTGDKIYFDDDNGLDLELAVADNVYYDEIDSAVTYEASGSLSNRQQLLNGIKGLMGIEPQLSLVEETYVMGYLNLFVPPGESEEELKLQKQVDDVRRRKNEFVLKYGNKYNERAMITRLQNDFDIPIKVELSTYLMYILNKLFEVHPRKIQYKKSLNDQLLMELYDADKSLVSKWYSHVNNRLKNEMFDFGENASVIAPMNAGIPSREETKLLMDLKKDVVSQHVFFNKHINTCCIKGVVAPKDEYDRVVIHGKRASRMYTSADINNNVESQGEERYIIQEHPDIVNESVETTVLKEGKITSRQEAFKEFTNEFPQLVAKFIEYQSVDKPKVSSLNSICTRFLRGYLLRVLQEDDKQLYNFCATCSGVAYDSNSAYDMCKYLIDLLDNKIVIEDELVHFIEMNT